ncbi:MAG: spore germination protein [Clostridia bacterium]|nr:spore germination protein [Clostridia bacterium]
MSASLSPLYAENLVRFDSLLGVGRSFDAVKKPFSVCGVSFTLYAIDGLFKSELTERLLEHFLSLPLPALPRSADAFLREAVPLGEGKVLSDEGAALAEVLAGSAALFCESFGAAAIVLNVRAGTGRQTEEPENDKVLQGAHDGFVETLLSNTALVRRRIRSEKLTLSLHTVGVSSKTDVCVAYYAGRADEDYVRRVEKTLDEIKTDALPLGQQSLAECLLRHNWYNPLPKVRYTERPDKAAAQLLEGNVLLFCDTSPTAMILPTSIFEFMQETNDYTLPPVTGCYLRLVRHAAFLLTVFFTPLWLILISSPQLLPDWLSFILPEKKAQLPVAAQLLLVEFMIDALKLASLNTPSPLSGSLSAIAGLILGDFAVEVGWLIPEVVLYMAFVAVVSFAQPGVELGFAFKFLRVLLLILSALFGFPGFFAGCGVIVFLLLTNKTVAGRGFYLYPLLPFDKKALARLLFRTKKDD